MEDNWKKDLVTDSYGNPVRSISNLRLIFTLDENLSRIRYDTFCQDDVCFSPLFRNVMVTRLMRNRQERYKTIWKGHTDYI